MCSFLVLLSSVLFLIYSSFLCVYYSFSPLLSYFVFLMVSVFCLFSSFCFSREFNIGSVYFQWHVLPVVIIRHHTSFLRLKSVWVPRLRCTCHSLMMEASPTPAKIVDPVEVADDAASVEPHPSPFNISLSMFISCFQYTQHKQLWVPVLFPVSGSI